MASLWFDQALLADGWARHVRVAIDDARIVRVERDAAPVAGDERHAIAVPGMPNVHSHAFQRGMAGLAERRGATTDTFWTWRETMYRFALTMSPDDVEVVAAQLYAEMLETGFTRVGEFHYLHHDLDGRPYADIAEMAARIAAAAAETGIALTLLPSFYAHATFGGAAPHDGQRRFICSLDRFARLLEASRRQVAALPGATVGVAPHSLRAVTPEELLAVVAMAPAGPIHIHAAEQTKEVDDCVAWSGQRPVGWLLAHAGVDTRWCLVHATHMTAEEVRLLARSGAVAGLCPITEANLGDGTFPAPEFLGHGGRFAIGSDSNILIGPGCELRQLEYAQRLRLRERNVLGDGNVRSTGRVLFDAGLAGGAAALACGPAGIAAGAAADLVSLDPHHPALVGRTGDTLLDAWVFAAATNPVDCVWVSGRRVVTGGSHRHRQAIADRFRRCMARLVA